MAHPIKVKRNMKQKRTQLTTGICFIGIFLSMAGCSSKKEASSGPVPPANPAAAINDPRMPPAQKAALQQTIAQQKANAAEVDAKMKAYAARKP
jgi:hypothetical protein